MDIIMKKFLNAEYFYEKENEAKQIENEEDRKFILSLLENIQDSVNDYIFFTSKGEYKKYFNSLIERGIEFIPVCKADLAEKFDKIFEEVVENDKKNNPDFNLDFRWYIFSCELVESLEWEAAKMAFDKAEKSSLYMFSECSDDAFHIKNAQLLTAVDLEILCVYNFGASDRYLFPDDLKWVYATTHHEPDCGPFFHIAK